MASDLPMTPRVRDYHNYIAMDHTHLRDLVLHWNVYISIFSTSFLLNMPQNMKKLKKLNTVFWAVLWILLAVYFFLQNRYLTEQLLEYPWNPCLCAVQYNLDRTPLGKLLWYFAFNQLKMQYAKLNTVWDYCPSHLSDLLESVQHCSAKIVQSNVIPHFGTEPLFSTRLW